MTSIGLPGVKVHYVDDAATVASGVRKKDSVNWSQSLLGIPQLWRQEQGQGVKVAVLDTGCDMDHPDLKTAIVAHRDFTGDGIEDKNGHGTHCAGIIGARMNQYGFVGVAPKCELVIGKVLGNNGSGAYSWIRDSIRWAVDEGCRIISMSLGGPVHDDGLFRVIHEALAEGACIIVAAGNEGSIFRNSIGYPGRYGSVITVASHDRNGNRSGFSSRGGEIDFMAPGSDIWSTYKDGGYASLSGTSMATPFVSGLSALIMGTTTINTCEDLRNELMEMSTHPGYHDNVRGYGPLQPFGYFQDY